MKKIVGILAVAAVLATSVFAADVSAKVKLDGELINYDGTKEKDGFSAIMIQHNGNESWNPVLSLAVSDDKSGAEVQFYVGDWDATKMGSWNHGYGIGALTWRIWFKPIDVLKITAGLLDEYTNREHINWDHTLYNYERHFGYKAEVSTNGFTLGAAFHIHDPWGSALPGTFWFSQSNDKAVINGFSINASYAADFGTILGLFDFNNTFKKINANVGFSKGFGEMSFFVDAGLAVDSTTEGADAIIGLGVDADFRYQKDAIYFEAYAHWAAATLKTIDTDHMSLYAKA